MKRKGHRKYICMDCKETMYVHWTERSRHTRPKCRYCGSVWLEPYSVGSQIELVEEARVLHSQPDERHVLKDTSLRRKVRGKR